MLSILHLGHRMFIATRRCLLFSQSVPLRLGSCHCVPSPTGLARYRHVPRTPPLFDMGNAATASCLLNQIEHAPDQGGTGGQQSSVEECLLRGSTVSGSMDRGPHPQSMVGWRVFDHRVASVARGLGSHLGGRCLAGLGRVVVALAIKTRRSHTHTHRRPASRRAWRYCRGQPGSTALSPPLHRDDSSSPRPASTAPNAPKEAACFAGSTGHQPRS
jgi:hypothetical protein